MVRVVCALNYGILTIKGQHAFHLCDNSNCTNPEHIYPDTPTVNVVDLAEYFKVRSAKTYNSRPPCKFVCDGVSPRK